MNRPRRHRTGLPKYCYIKAGKYVMYYPEGGKLLSRSYGRDLQAMLADWIEIYGHSDEARTIGEVMDAYLHSEVPRLAERTQRDYHRHIDKLRPVFGHMSPGKLTAQHVFTWQQRRGAQSVVQCNREKAVLQNVMQLALRLGLVSMNIVRQIPKLSERPRDREVLESEFALVYGVAPPIVQSAMLLAVLTGMRQGDLLALRRDQLTDDGIRYTPAKTRGRGGKRLLIEWSPALRDAVDKCLSIRRIASVYVLCNEAGQRYTSSGFQTLWQKTIKQARAAGLKETFTFHDLRAMAAGKTDDWRLLGHLDETTFRRVYDRRERRVKPTE